MKAINLIPIFIITVCLFSSCEWGDVKNFNRNMGKISDGVKKFDSSAENFSRGATKFAKKVESYVDTTQYKKDSTGMWKKKE